MNNFTLLFRYCLKTLDLTAEEVVQLPTEEFIKLIERLPNANFTDDEQFEIFEQIEDLKTGRVRKAIYQSEIRKPL